MDRIYVIDDGAVAQCGTYAELMAQSDGRFARLFASHHESADGSSRHSMQGIGHSPQSSM
jgi:ABC-type transport system involved in cytochrome bd biosynthesis fused ATPase/permease subunit